MESVGKVYFNLHNGQNITINLNTKRTHRFVDVDMLKNESADKIGKEQNFETH